MVAGDEHDFAPGSERGTQLSEDAPRRRDRTTERPLAQFDHVAEQHEPVDRRDSTCQRLQPVGVLEPAAAVARPEVQIRDDERSQRVPGRR